MNTWQAVGYIFLGIGILLLIIGLSAYSSLQANFDEQNRLLDSWTGGLYSDYMQDFQNQSVFASVAHYFLGTAVCFVVAVVALFKGNSKQSFGLGEIAEEKEPVVVLEVNESSTNYFKDIEKPQNVVENQKNTNNWRMAGIMLLGFGLLIVFTGVVVLNMVVSMTAVSVGGKESVTYLSPFIFGAIGCWVASTVCICKK
jgi:hypothetical protein